MTDMLARKRLNNNMIDQLVDAQHDLARLTTRAAIPDGDGRLNVFGLLLKVHDGPLAAPPTGHVLIGAYTSGGTTYVVAVDDAGDEHVLDSWV